MKLNEILHGAHESIPKNRHYRRPLYWHDLTLIPTWISYVIHDNVLDEITVHRWNLEIDKYFHHLPGMCLRIHARIKVYTG